MQTPRRTAQWTTRLTSRISIGAVRRTQKHECFEHGGNKDARNDERSKILSGPERKTGHPNQSRERSGRSRQKHDGASPPPQNGGARQSNHRGCPEHFNSSGPHAHFKSTNERETAMKEEQCDRTERLLALILLQNMKGSNLAAKARELSIAGFTNVEIADLLQTSSAVISQTLYAARKLKGK